MHTITADQITTGDRILWNSVGPVFATVTDVTAYYGYRTIHVTVDGTAEQRTVEEHRAHRFTVA